MEWSKDILDMVDVCRKRGKSWREIAAALGTKEYCVRQAYCRKNRKPKHNRSSICWHCENSISNGCSWAKSATLVPGAQYEERNINGELRKVIIECPQFARG